MKKTIVLFFIFSFSFFIYCHAQIITTVAGNTQAGYSGDGVAATATKLNAPCGVAIDKKGNIYIADQNNYRVRKVDTNGIISTFAGIGIQHYSGDGGPATDAELAYPVALAIDSKGNIFIADALNEIIWKVDTNNIIWRFAGATFAGYYGDGGLATNAQLDYPLGVAVDDSDNVYIADSYNNVIRKVNSGDTILAFAGNSYIGYVGDGGPAIDAEFRTPTNIAFGASGYLYIADYNNQRIRLVNTNGIITTVAGDSAHGYSGDGGEATSAELDKPYGVAASLGNFYIVDQGSERIRMVNSSGIISSIAGNGIEGYFGDGGPATAAELHYPTQIAIDAYNNIYFADQGNNVIRKIRDTNTVTGTNKLMTKSEEVRVYHNPNNGSFTLSLSNINEKCNVEIYNMFGEKLYGGILPKGIYSEKQAQYNEQINLDSQPGGVYLYRVLEEDGEIIGTGKFVIAP